jgi:hypothetical protein
MAGRFVCLQAGDESEVGVNQREYFLHFLDRLPVLDLTWSDEIQTAWWRCYDVLWRWACRLIVEDGIAQYVNRSRPALTPPRYKGTFVIRNADGAY